MNDTNELEAIYLQRWDDVPEGIGFTNRGRQILHCTFGSVLTHPGLGQALMARVETHADTYAEVLESHFVRHLRALQSGM